MRSRCIPFLLSILIILVTFPQSSSVAYAFQHRLFPANGKTNDGHSNHFIRSTRFACFTTATTSDDEGTIRTAAASPFISVRECIDLFHKDDGGGQRNGDDGDGRGGGSIKFVDASWYHKGERDGRDEYERGPRITGSTCHLDLSDLCDRAHSVKHMLPSSAMFAVAMDAWNIRRNDHVILYGRANGGTAFLPRAWFIFALFGHVKTSIMQGTLDDWIAMGGPIEEHVVQTVRISDLYSISSSLTSQNTTNYPIRSSIQSNRVATLEDMRKLISPRGPIDDTIILDARGSSFSNGYIPGSINIPYSSLLDAKESGRYFRPRDELEQIFENVGIHLNDNTMMIPSRIICTCNSGVSACCLYLALRECGVPESVLQVYDGSWQEYTLYPDLPKVIPPKDTSNE